MNPLADEGKAGPVQLDDIRLSEYSDSTLLSLLNHFCPVRRGSRRRGLKGFSAFNVPKIRGLLCKSVASAAVFINRGDAIHAHAIALHADVNRSNDRVSGLCGQVRQHKHTTGTISSLRCFALEAASLADLNGLPLAISSGAGGAICADAAGVAGFLDSEAAESAVSA